MEKKMSYSELLQKYERIFFTKFEYGASEFEEMFEAACRFGRRLADSGDRYAELKKNLLAWIKEASEYEPED